MRFPFSAVLRRPFPAARRPAAATTITELMVVLAIVALLSTVALSLFTQYEKTSRTASEAYKIGKLFGFARSQAIARNSPCQVTFWLQPDANLSKERFSYWVDELTPDRTAISGPQIVTPEPTDALVRIPSVRINDTVTTEGTAFVLFLPDGSSDRAWVHLLHREDAASSATIQVYGPTGHSRVIEGRRTP